MAKYYGNIKGERAENGDQGLEGETEKGETKKERERERVKTIQVFTVVENKRGGNNSPNSLNLGSV